MFQWRYLLLGLMIIMAGHPTQAALKPPTPNLRYYQDRCHLPPDFWQKDFLDQLAALDLTVSFPSPDDVCDISEQIFPELQKYFQESPLADEISFVVLRGYSRPAQPTAPDEVPIPSLWGHRPRMIAIIKLKDPSKTTTPLAQFVAKIQKLLGIEGPLTFDPQTMLLNKGLGLYDPSTNYFNCGPYLLAVMLKATKLEDITGHPVIIHELFHMEQDVLKRFGTLNLTSGTIYPLPSATRPGLVPAEPFTVNEGYAHALSLKAQLQVLIREFPTTQMRVPAFDQAFMMAYDGFGNLNHYLPMALKVIDQAIMHLKKFRNALKALAHNTALSPNPFDLPYTYYAKLESIIIPVVLEGPSAEGQSARYDYLLPRQVITQLTANVPPEQIPSVLYNEQALNEVITFLQAQEEFITALATSTHNLRSTWDSFFPNPSNPRPQPFTPQDLQKMHDKFVLPDFKFISCRSNLTSSSEQ